MEDDSGVTGLISAETQVNAEKGMYDQKDGMFLFAIKNSFSDTSFERRLMVK